MKYEDYLGRSHIWEFDENITLAHNVRVYLLKPLLDGLNITLPSDGQEFVLFNSGPHLVEIAEVAPLPSGEAAFIYKCEDTWIYKLKTFILSEPMTTEPESMSLTISTDQEDLNIRDLADMNGYDGLHPLHLTLNITESATITCSSGIIACVDTGIFPAGSRITLNNYGKILGRGGNASHLEVLGAGGTCLFCRVPVFLYNFGEMLAGGGGANTISIIEGCGGQGTPGGLSRMEEWGGDTDPVDTELRACGTTERPGEYRPRYVGYSFANGGCCGCHGQSTPNEEYRNPDARHIDAHPGGMVAICYDNLDVFELGDMSGCIADFETFKFTFYFSKGRVTPFDPIEQIGGISRVWFQHFNFWEDKDLRPEVTIYIGNEAQWGSWHRRDDAISLGDTYSTPEAVYTHWRDLNIVANIYNYGEIIGIGGDVGWLNEFDHAGDLFETGESLTVHNFGVIAPGGGVGNHGDQPEAKAGAGQGLPPGIPYSETYPNTRATEDNPGVGYDGAGNGGGLGQRGGNNGQAPGRIAVGKGTVRFFGAKPL